jgi:beta-lactamase class A
MAQYGDPQNPDSSRFQRYRPEADPASQGRIPNAQPGSAAAGGNAYNSQGYGPNPAPQQAAASNGASSNPQSADRSRAWEDANSWTDSLDGGWNQGLSGVARKRNQWRQFQYLKADFGNPEPVVEPSPAAPPRNASLPSFAARAGKPSPHAPGPQQHYRQQNFVGQNPMGQNPMGQNPMGQNRPPEGANPRLSPGGLQSRGNNLTGAVGQPNGLGSHTSGLSLPRSQRPPMATQPPFAAGANLQQGNQALQPHPHSTALPHRPEPHGPGSRPDSPAHAASKVTPLRPGRRKARETPKSQGGMAAVASSQPRDIALADPGVEPRPRPGARPQRRLPKPPLAVLYLIRLLIFGVGVAAIAGTLLSVLSPSNLADSSGQEDTSDVALGTASGPLVAGTTASLVNDVALAQEMTRLQAEIEQLGALTPGLTQSVFMVDLDTGDYVDVAGSQTMAAASTIKVPILVAFLQEVDAGNIALNQGMVMQEEQMAGGSGTMQNQAVGTRYTALEVASQMIVTSDNTATNMVIDALGGMEALNQRFQAWGLESTVLRNPLPDLDGTNTTSTRDLALLMALVDQGGLLSSRSRDRMFSIMQRTANRSLIPFGINDDSLLANKTGNLDEVLGDVALIDVPNGRRYVMAVLVERPDNDGRASELIRRTAETGHTEFSQPIAPVGGMDPSSAEDSVPDQDGPDNDADPANEVPDTEPPNREQIPQG